MHEELKVGFWSPPDSYPNVEDHIDPNWRRDKPEEYLMVVTHLHTKGLQAAAYRGYSSCRCCGVHNGSVDMTDGTYTWPKGYLHYILEHHVKPPQEFIEHVRFFDVKKRLQANPRPTKEMLEALWGGKAAR